METELAQQAIESSLVADNAGAIILGLLGVIYALWKEVKERRSAPKKEIMDKESSMKNETRAVITQIAERQTNIGQRQETMMQTQAEGMRLNQELKKMIIEINRWTGLLHEWHDTKNQDGNFVWYVPKDLIDEIKKVKGLVYELKNSGKSSGTS